MSICVFFFQFVFLTSCFVWFLCCHHCHPPVFLPGQVDKDLGNNKRLDFDRDLGQAFTAHQMDHMKQALEDVGHFDGKFQNIKMDDVIPDGQTNTFQTEKGIVSDWAVSADAPEWIVAQARRSGGENSILKRDNTHTVQTGIRMDEGQINEFGFSQTGAGADGSTGMQSDWAVSGDAPDWITSNVAKYDQNAVIHRPQKTQDTKMYPCLCENPAHIFGSHVKLDAVCNSNKPGGFFITLWMYLNKSVVRNHFYEA